jgi:hypothetical protein
VSVLERPARLIGQAGRQVDGHDRSWK